MLPLLYSLSEPRLNEIDMTLSELWLHTLETSYVYEMLSGSLTCRTNFIKLLVMIFDPSYEIIFGSILVPFLVLVLVGSMILVPYRRLIWWMLCSLVFARPLQGQVIMSSSGDRASLTVNLDFVEHISKFD